MFGLIQAANMLLLDTLVLLLTSLCTLQVYGAQLRPGSSLLIKLAVFVDESLRQHLAVDFELIRPDELETLMGAYVGQMEAALAGLRSEHLAGGVKLKLVEVDKFNATSGDLDRLLSDFCLHQMETRQTANIKWHLGLLLTSRDLYSSEDNEREDSFSTLGISPVSGIDWPDLSCLVVELGVDYQLEALEDSPNQRIYPTRGLASAYVAAHELAHSLGLQHDDATCDLAGAHVMSAIQSSRLDKLRLRWSTCSSARLDQLAPSLLARFGHSEGESLPSNQLPGQLFDGQFQCRMFSRRLNFEANKGGGETICNKTLLCTTNDNRLVAIGPALEGTRCGGGDNKERLCLRNTCSEPSFLQPSPPITASELDL